MGLGLPQVNLGGTQTFRLQQQIPSSSHYLSYQYIGNIFMAINRGHAKKILFNQQNKMLCSKSTDTVIAQEMKL